MENCGWPLLTDLQFLTGKTTSYKYYRNKPGDITSLSNNRINDIFEGKNRNLWIATANGLNRFNRRKENFFVYKNDISKPQSLSFNIVSSIYEDKNGVLWVGTIGRGLNLYTKRNDLFKKYVPESQNLNSLNNSFIYSISEDRNKNLWIGTQGGGINKINKERNKYSFYRFNASDNKSISLDYISKIFEDKEGTVWIATFGNGLNRYMPEKDHFKRYMNNINAPFSILNIRSIIESERSPGILWFGTATGGLLKFNKKNETFNLFFKPIIGLTDPFAIRIGEKNKNLNSNTIYYIYEAPSKKGIIWISSTKGLNSFDIEKEKFFKYGRKGDVLNNFSLQGIIENTKYPGILWIGTLGRGLIKFNIKNKAIDKIYTDKDGLPNNVIYCLLEDKNNNLWISTNRGISKFNIDRDSFNNYNEEDGLQGLEFNGNAAYLSSSGEMFFGGTNGFNSFFPDNISLNKRIPNIYITEFKVFNESVKVGKNSILKKKYI